MPAFDRPFMQRCASAAIMAVHVNTPAAQRTGLQQRLSAGAPFVALVLLAAQAGAEPVGPAQATVYKCGSAGHIRYEDKPCTEGRAVDVSDPRTPAQQAEALARTARQAQEAQSLGQERLQAEQREMMLLEQAQRQAAQQAQAVPAPSSPPVVVVVRPDHRMPAPQTPPPPWPVWPQALQVPQAPMQKPAPAPAAKASHPAARDPLRP